MKPKKRPLHVYVIDDGEQHWYAAVSERSAMTRYRRDTWTTAANTREVTVVQCSDFQELTVTSRAQDTGEPKDEHRTQICREWAEEAGSGLIATTDDS